MKTRKLLALSLALLMAVTLFASCSKKSDPEDTAPSSGKTELVIGFTSMYSTPMILAWGSSNPMTNYKLFHSSNAGKDDWYNPENFRNGRYIPRCGS